MQNQKKKARSKAAGEGAPLYMCKCCASTECAVSNNEATCGTLRALWPSLSSFILMFRRLEDRTRQLCAWAVASEDPVELHEILIQLRAAFREHIERVRLPPVNPSSPQRRAVDI
jgi:hypothetical protein